MYYLVFPAQDLSLGNDGAGGPPCQQLGSTRKEPTPLTNQSMERSTYQS